MLTATVQGVLESFKRRLDGQSQRWRKVLSGSSKEITGAGIAFRRLRSKPRDEKEDPWSTSVVSLTVTNRGELVSCCCCRPLFPCRGPLLWLLLLLNNGVRINA